MRALATSIVLLLGSALPGNVQGQGVAEAMVRRLQVSCETQPELRGAMVRSGTLAEGVLTLTGTLDDPETQARLLEAEAARILKEEPTWRAEIKGGITAKQMARFALRSGVLRSLQTSFAESPNDAEGRPGLLRQTRLDDLYFDRNGRLRLVGLCVNQRAFSWRKGDVANTSANPLGEIAQGLRDRLRNEPPHSGVDPEIFAALQVDGIRFEEDPSRPLQRAAIQIPGIDTCLFLDSQFDEQGRLVLSGYLPTSAFSAGKDREAVKALLNAPEFSKTYQRPRGVLADDAEDVLAGLWKYDWRPGLLKDLQARCARPAEQGEGQSYRHCRIDRAVFDYRTTRGLILRFEGLSLVKDERDWISGDLRDWCARTFRFNQVVAYDINTEGFVGPDEPLPKILDRIQRRVAENPALDGVRVDDLTFGGDRETELVGVWAGEPQQEVLVSAVTPALVAGVGEGVRGLKVVPRMSHLPTLALLKELRGLVTQDASLDESSLDRLLFKPTDAPASPVLTLQVTALAETREKAEASLEKWRGTSDLAAMPGMWPEIEFLADRRESVRKALWESISRESKLDGVRLDHVRFDVDNALILDCVTETADQLHPGEALDKLLGMYRRSATTAWRGLPVPAARVESRGTYSLTRLLKILQEKLPSYEEADGVMLHRANWKSGTEIILHGLRSRKIDEPSLQKVIVNVVRLESVPVNLALDLNVHPVDHNRVTQYRNATLEAFKQGNIAEIQDGIADEVIFYVPEDSTAWYLRAAYHLAKKNPTLASRDLLRVFKIEGEDPTGRKAKERQRLVGTTTGAWKEQLDALERQAERASRNLKRPSPAPTRPKKD